jgi:ABC-2 type transport system permease protein
MPAKNVLHLGVKELWSLARDPGMLVLIAYAFSLSIYAVATGLPDTLHKASIASSQSPLSQRIVNAFQPPLFLPPKLVSREEMDARMDSGVDTFASSPNQQDVPASSPRISSTPTPPAWPGVQRQRLSDDRDGEVQLAERYRSAPRRRWWRSRRCPQREPDPVVVRRVVGLVDRSPLCRSRSPAADPRARRHGGALLVMPVTPAEIMTSKVWSWGWWCWSPPLLHEVRRAAGVPP